MRPLESYLVYSLMYSAAYGWVPLGNAAALVSLPFLLAHLFLEKPRWQLAPMYFFAVYFVYASISSQAFSGLALAAIEFAIVLAAALPCIMPVAKLPPLTGPYKTIGVVSRYAIRSDMSRREGVNSLVVKVFYPAAITPPQPTTPRAKYTSYQMAASIARFIHLPGVALHHVSLAHLNALESVALPAGSERFPAVIFSHGLGGNSDCYSIQAEALASHGFIVFCPTHQDRSSSLAVMANNTTLPYYRPTPDELTQKQPENIRHRQLQQRVREMQFLMDSIENFEANGWPAAAPWQNRVDTSRFSAVGHSFGGSTSLLLADSDTRIRAVVDHDGWMFPVPPALIVRGVAVPALFTLSEPFYVWTENMTPMRELFGHSHGSSKLLLIKGTGHSNFSDPPLFGSVIAKLLKQIGSLKLRESYDIINELNVQFLNVHLKIKPTTEMKGNDAKDSAESSVFSPEKIASAIMML